MNQRGKDSQRNSLERLARRPFLAGNSVRVFPEGSSVFEEFFRAVAAAERTVCLDYYIFRDDETGWSLAELLARKSRQGVRVYLIYDHFGCLTTSDRFWKFLRSAGVEVRSFHAPQWRRPNLYFHRDHRKMAVIDGREAFTGGLNVGDEYRGLLKKKLKGWRDTAVKVRGPVAGAMLQAFQESWRECGGREVGGQECFAAQREEDDVGLLPLFSSSRRSMRALRLLLQFSVSAARKSIHLTMAYFIPTHRFLLFLLGAARHGVDVKIILPGQSDLRLVAYAGRTYYKTLLRAGVHIFHYQPRILHAKTMVFDGRWSIVGSANLGARSLNYNYECGVGILDGPFGEEMEKIFARDLLECTPVTEEELSRWPLYERALGTFLSWFRSYL